MASAAGRISRAGLQERAARASHAVLRIRRGPLEDDMAPCKFAEKVWNAQEAGAQGVSAEPGTLPPALLRPPAQPALTPTLAPRQVVVVNYEDKHTTMEAPDDQDEVSYRCAARAQPLQAPRSAPPLHACSELWTRRARCCPPPGMHA